MADSGIAIARDNLGHRIRMLGRPEPALLKHPSADQLDRHYLDLGSEGLRHFAKMRHVCARMIAAAIEHHPETFADARRCTTPCRPWSDA
jgi:hypothetical protein